jgi:thymidine kinase
MHINHGRHSGWIEVICGPMFSGKTEELIRRLRLAHIAKQRIQIFKPAIDNRFCDGHIVSHNEQKFGCTTVTRPEEILDSIEDSTRIVGIDEVQFFDDSIATICEKLANRGLRVIVTGLDQDYLGNPFGPMPKLLALAESILKLKAVCQVCGGWATKSQRLTPELAQVSVGATDKYEARCRACYDPKMNVEEIQNVIPLIQPNGDDTTK